MSIAKKKKKQINKANYNHILFVFSNPDMKSFIQPYFLNSYYLLSSILGTEDKNGKQENVAPIMKLTVQLKK